jgi:hypothetical protein
MVPKVHMLKSNTTIIWTIVFEWYVVKCKFKKGHQKDMVMNTTFVRQLRLKERKPLAEHKTMYHYQWGLHKPPFKSKYIPLPLLFPLATHFVLTKSPHILGGCIVLNLYGSTWVHMRGIDLDLPVLHIHTIDIFRTEKHSRILTLDIYIYITEYICIQRYLDI